MNNVVRPPSRLTTSDCGGGNLFSYCCSLLHASLDDIYLPYRGGREGLLPRISSICDMISGVSFSIRSSDLRFSMICSGFDAPRMTVETFYKGQDEGHVSAILSASIVKPPTGNLRGS